MKMTGRTAATLPRALPRRVRSAVNKRAHELAAEHFRQVAADLMDAVAEGRVRPQAVVLWRPEHG